MLGNILKNVEMINRKIYEVSRFNYLDLTGAIILSEEWESFGVILMDDEREILFSISESGQFMALHESNQRLISGLRLKILSLIELMKQRESMFHRFVHQISDQPFDSNDLLIGEIENLG